MTPISIPRPSATAERSVRRVALPPAARRLSTLPRIDYADAFHLSHGSPGARTGEQWARATLEGAPAAVREQLRRGWSLIGLRLDDAPAHRSVLGWEIRHSTPEFALLGARSRIGMPAELLFWPQGDALLFATLIRHGNPLTRALWLPVIPFHVQVVTRLLDRAGRPNGGRAERTGRAATVA